MAVSSSGPASAGSDSGLAAAIVGAWRLESTLHPGREPWSSEDEPPERELRAIHAHFIAYCGRYEVYEQAGLVIHRLEMHVTPNFVGNVLVRRASLEGPRLTLRPLEEELPAGMLEYTLRWRRAERASGELDHTG